MDTFGRKIALGSVPKLSYWVMWTAFLKNWEVVPNIVIFLPCSSSLFFSSLLLSSLLWPKISAFAPSLLHILYFDSIYHVSSLSTIRFQTPCWWRNSAWDKLDRYTSFPAIATFYPRDNGEEKQCFRRAVCVGHRHRTLLRCSCSGRAQEKILTDREWCFWKIWICIKQSTEATVCSSESIW